MKTSERGLSLFDQRLSSIEIMLHRCKELVNLIGNSVGLVGLDRGFGSLSIDDFLLSTDNSSLLVGLRFGLLDLD